VALVPAQVVLRIVRALPAPALSKTTTNPVAHGRVLPPVKTDHLVAARALVHPGTMTSRAARVPVPQTAATDHLVAARAHALLLAAKTVLRAISVAPLATMSAFARLVPAPATVKNAPAVPGASARKGIANRAPVAAVDGVLAKANPPGASPPAGLQDPQTGSARPKKVRENARNTVFLYSCHGSHSR